MTFLRSVFHFLLLRRLAFLAALRALSALCFLMTSSRERGKLQGTDLSRIGRQPDVYDRDAKDASMANLVEALFIERHLIAGYACEQPSVLCGPFWLSEP